MNPELQREYNKRLVSAETAAASIKDGDRIVTGTGATQPVDIYLALAERKHELKDVEIICSFFLEPYGFLEEDSIGHINTLTTFMGVKEREYYYRKGITDNIKVFTYDFVNTGRAIEALFKPTVYMCQVSEPDENGYFSLGTTGSMYGRASADYADRIILQVNKKMPYCHGAKEDAFVHISEVDMIVESDRDLFKVDLGEPSELDKQTASYILPYIGDGATIQLGLGGIANAIGFSLADRQHLGIHTESYLDSMMYLTQKGVIDNSLKKENKGISITSFALGTQELYDFVDHNPDIHMMAIHKVTDPNRIGAIDNFISINSCMNADLTGQVGSESIGLKQFSSQGGQVAFVRGANLSKGGKSFLCMRSTNKSKDGNISSTIDLGLPYGTAVTTPRHDVDCIVTEWGCAELKYKALNERAIEMIKIAHPDFRQRLYDEALEKHIVYKHQAYKL